MRSTVDGIGSLPLELLLDILMRLQVKFLCRCKRVSKNWCSLIESPSFVKQHFEQERNRERLFIRIWERNHEVHDVNKELNRNDQQVNEEPDQEGENGLYIEDGEYKCALYVDDAFSEYELPSHLQMPDQVTDLFGPLNGIFCAVTQRGQGLMALLNPALRQFKPLPFVQQYQRNLRLVDIELGLGFDPLTDDYKLVMLHNFWDIMSEEEHHFVYVCTSESDSWRLLEDVDPIISGGHVSRSFGVTYLSGVYYWLLEFDETCTNLQILAFDMAIEKFRKLLVLGPAPAESMWDYLVLCGDSLALLEYDENERCIDVWMMVNEGCWIRKSRVGPLDDFRRPLYFWRKDELLVETLKGFLTLCNISNHESKIVRVQNVDKCDLLHWVFVYKESLVSIKGKAGKCKLY